MVAAGSGPGESGHDDAGRARAGAAVATGTAQHGRRTLADRADRGAAMPSACIELRARHDVCGCHRSSPADAARGGAVGRLTRGLQDFRHPAGDRQHDWNLLRLPTLLGEIAHIEDAGLRAIVQTHAEAFCARLPSWRTQLPITVLHNDANDLNVIVADDGGGQRVRAVIDFGDMCTSFRLADLAIACTYAMQHEADPVSCARTIVRGYLAQCSLLRVELEQLHAFILARLCHSVLMATRAHREEPDNPFILVSQQGVRALLRELAEVDHDAIVGPFPEPSHD